MLQKIISVKNIGRFLGFEALSLPNYTLIFGENGVGKSTLCAILRSLKTGEPAHIAGRQTRGSQEQPAVELLLDDEEIDFKDGAWLSKDGPWPSPYPDLAIFDDDFVTENVHSAGVVEAEQRRGLLRVIIGEKGVRLEKEAKELAEKSEGKTREITRAKSEIKPYAPQGMTVEKFIELKPDEKIDAQISGQKGTFEAAKNAESISKQEMLSEIKILPDNFKDLLARNIMKDAQKHAVKNAQDCVDKHLKKHLTKNKITASDRDWIANGLENLGETCPFCGQGIGGLELIEAYQAVFSEGYEGLRKEIKEMDERIAGKFGDGATNLKNLNQVGIVFWKKFCDFDPESLAVSDEVFDAIKALGQAAHSLLERKSQRIFEPIIINLDEEFSAYKDTLAKVREINKAVREVNAQCQAKREEISKTTPEEAEVELDKLQKIKSRYNNPDIVKKCDSYHILVGEKSNIDIDKKIVQNKLKKLNEDEVFKSYVDRINKYFNEGGFKTTFKIGEMKYENPKGIPETTYGLYITGYENASTELIKLGNKSTAPDQPSFKNTLSSGDRSTLALAFFFFHLEQDDDLADKTVVFDDPFGSQDAFRRGYTVDKITEIVKEGAQVIVLSHNVEFLDHIWEKSPTDKRVALELKGEPELGTKILSWGILNAQDVQDLRVFCDTQNGRPRDIIRKPRVVLEDHFLRNYPKSFPRIRTLGKIVNKIRECGDQHPAYIYLDDLKKINKYTSPYHHGRKIKHTSEIDRGKLTECVKLTLEIIGRPPSF